jgi:hypothetical protein
MAAKGIIFLSVIDVMAFLLVLEASEEDINTFHYHIVRLYIVVAVMQYE